MSNTDKAKLRTSTKIRTEKNLTADSYVPAAYLPAHGAGSLGDEQFKEDANMSKLTSQELAAETKREKMQRESIEELKREVS